MQTAIPVDMIRGGTSRGLYFLREHLPADASTRDQVLLACMGSPHIRQIDGVGGGHPLTSKVAVISKSADERADVDYHFLQVAVDRAQVSDAQNCGNILAGVGPFAIEQGLLPVTDAETAVRIRMLNTGGYAVAHVHTPDGRVCYDGAARIDGVPGTAAPVVLEFLDVTGASCGSLLPAGDPTTTIDGIDTCCIDNGMPVVILAAEDVGKSGYEKPSELEADATLTKRIERIRLEAGKMMNLGDVSNKTVPKMCLVATAQHGGAITTRTFIPQRVHESIGVLGAVSVATACLLPGSVAQMISGLTADNGKYTLDVEHPSGYFTVELEVTTDGKSISVQRSALLRTSRKIMQGVIFIPGHVWAGP